MKRLGWLAFAFFLAYFIFLIRQDIIDYAELRGQREKLSREAGRQAVSTRQLQRRLGKLQEAELIEELARTRLGLVRRDETAYKVIR
ncbi:MAG: septum formation initiator family protein [Candidatus Margulisbacteria bacterium]|jgi:cell division protein FtsB|nr:septum formation initiator family protein [Candidatus Margulisiibacteriota bacterium]